MKAGFRNILIPKCEWLILFIATIWGLWKSLNKWVYQNKREPFHVTIQNIKLLVHDLRGIAVRSEPKRMVCVEEQMWLKPLQGWVKLNMDAAAGGVVRDERGDWLVGFAMKLTITVAELHVLHEGLKIAWGRRWPKIAIETDLEVVFKLVSKEDVRHQPLENIIRDCKILLHKRWQTV